MKFAVIKTGGKQYKVAEGETIQVEMLSGAEVGKSYTFEEVLLSGDDKDTKLGLPLISGAKVSATVVGAGRGKKIEVIKYKPKARYFKKRGHRQPFMTIKIDKIS